MPNQYDKLISMIQLEDIYVSKIKCSRSEEFKDQKQPQRIHLEYDIKAIKQTGIEITIPVFFKVAPYYAGEKNEILFEDAGEKNILFSIECEIDLKYMITLEESEKQDMSEFKNELQMFAKKNVPVNVWPYARELFSSLSSRMGFSSLIIPVFKKLPKY